MATDPEVDELRMLREGTRLPREVWNRQLELLGDARCRLDGLTGGGDGGVADGALGAPAGRPVAMHPFQMVCQAGPAEGTTEVRFYTGKAFGCGPDGMYRAVPVTLNGTELTWFDDPAVTDKSDVPFFTFSDQGSGEHKFWLKMTLASDVDCCGLSLVSAELIEQMAGDSDPVDANGVVHLLVGYIEWGDCVHKVQCLSHNPLIDPPDCADDGGGGGTPGSGSGGGGSGATETLECDVDMVVDLGADSEGCRVQKSVRVTFLMDKVDGEVVGFECLSQDLDEFKVEECDPDGTPGTPGTPGTDDGTPGTGSGSGSGSDGSGGSGSGSDDDCIDRELVLCVTGPGYTRTMTWNPVSQRWEADNGDYLVAAGTTATIYDSSSNVEAVLTDPALDPCSPIDDNYSNGFEVGAGACICSDAYDVSGATGAYAFLNGTYVETAPQSGVWIPAGGQPANPPGGNVFLTFSTTAWTLSYGGGVPLSKKWVGGDMSCPDGTYISVTIGGGPTGGVLLIVPS